MPQLIASPDGASGRRSWLAGLRDDAPSGSSRWLRRARNIVLVVVALVALYAVLGFFVLPSIARTQFETRLTEQLGRRATLGKVEFNPFTLQARLSDFALANREASGTLVRFDALDLDISSASIRYLAPVFDAVRLVRPRIDLVRNADGTYSVQDLVDLASAKPATPRPPPQFSLNNIEIEDGALSLDDKPHGRTLNVTNIGIGIPFLSSLAHDAEIRVTPRLDGAVDGARFALKGTSTTPFADTQEATLNFDLDRMALARYAEYWQLPSGIKLVDGALTSRLIVAFTTEKGAARALTVSGAARLDRPALARRDGLPLASAGSIDVAVSKIDPLAGVVALDRVVIESPRFDIRRAGDGSFELERLLAAPASSAHKAAQTDAKPWRVSIADASIAAGTVQLDDEAVSPTFKATLSALAANGKHIDVNGNASFDVAFDTDSGAHFAGRADANIPGESAKGNFELKAFRLDKLYPYYASALNLDVRRGTVDMTANFDVAAGKGSPQVKLSDGNATLRDIEMALTGDRDPLWRIARAALAGIAFDLRQRTIAIDRAEVPEATIRVVREADGSVEFDRIVKHATADRKPDAAAGAEQGWSYAIHKLTFDRAIAAFEDRAPKPPVKLRIEAKVNASDFGNARGSKGTIDVAARVPPAGRVRFAGALATHPVALDWRIDATGVNLVPLRPYYEARTNVIVTSGAAAAKGRLVYTSGAHAAARASYAGDITISDFASLDRPTSQELLRWKTLTLTGVDAGMAPQKFAIGAVALDQYYARIIVNPDATLNLQQLLAPESATTGAPATATTTGRTVVTSASATRELPEPATDRELPVSIGRINVNGGEVQFSDFFIKPNYSAHLTNVSGTVSGLSATQAGQVELNARVENTAPVEVRGSVNPFARQLALDLTAKATDIDLPPLTPYSGKYAGYGIQKGKLSFEVHYAIDQRKLAATNKLTLDQLTFGERIESPTATKLPVLLAVALLKDRNGVINLDLPIQGTLDDPQFSVWRIVVQIIGNLITKIVTAPFAVLGALAGGGGEQLSYVEFAAGRADISEASESKLRSLAKALADRPALKLDAVGRAIPDVDRDGLKRATLDRAVRAQKQKALAAEGDSVESVKVEADEYPRYLKAVYKDTKLPDKPRNMLGFDKDIPPEEMEALLLASYTADETALRDLANRRAQSVKDWLVGQGGVSSERVFVVAPKLTGAGIEDKGALTRVDFSIK